MYKIGTLNKISPVGLSNLTDQYTVSDDLTGANGIIVRSAKMHDMDFDPALLAIGRAGAGVNNIPLDRCADEGIVVFNAPGANANAVKELVIAGMLLSARNIPAGLKWAETLIGTEGVKDAVEKGKGQFAGTEITGKTLGVIGLGAIGVMVANAASDLGMIVKGYDPFMSPKSAEMIKSTVTVSDDLDDVITGCDYVSLHIPANDSTKGMMNASLIEKMKDGAVLVNFARDTLINEDDLFAALESGKLKNYVTDFPNDNVIGKEGVISTPHLGASTTEAEDNCATMAAIELMDYIENGNIANSVNYPAVNLGKVADGVSRISILGKADNSFTEDITAAIAAAGAEIKGSVSAVKDTHAAAIFDVDKGTDDLVTTINAIDSVIKARMLG